MSDAPRHFGQVAPWCDAGTMGRPRCHRRRTGNLVGGMAVPSRRQGLAAIQRPPPPDVIAGPGGLLGKCSRSFLAGGKKGWQSGSGLIAYKSRCDQYSDARSGQTTSLVPQRFQVAQSHEGCVPCNTGRGTVDGRQKVAVKCSSERQNGVRR